LLIILKLTIIANELNDADEEKPPTSGDVVVCVHLRCTKYSDSKKLGRIIFLLEIFCRHGCAGFDGRLLNA